MKLYKIFRQTSLIKPEVNADNKEKSSVKKSQRRPQLDVPLGTPQTPSVALPSEVLPSDVSDSNKVFIGDFEVVIENGKFICPVKVCGKHFRRENLLHVSYFILKSFICACKKK